MATATGTPSPFGVQVHPYDSKNMSHACMHELIPSKPHYAKPSHALVFIGGLGDGPHSVPAIRAVGERMNMELPDWSVFEVRIRSSYAQWGFGSLANDVVDIQEVVCHLRRKLGKQKIVLFGHSTGCQDCVAYAANIKNMVDSELVEGFMLQGPVSDREGTVPLLEAAGKSVQESLDYATDQIERLDPEAYMPRRLLPPGYNNPITAYRWKSLLSVGGDDDFFSSDLPDERLAEIWGEFRVPVLIVPSEKDEYVPEGVDFERLMTRWMGFCKPGVASKLSGLIPGANHCVDQPDGQDWLAERVVPFLKNLGEAQEAIDAAAGDAL